MAEKGSAGAAVSTYQVLDREMSAAARSASEEELRRAATCAAASPGLSPLEAAVLAIDHDLRTALAVLETVQAQARAFETFMRAMRADLDAVRAALGSAKP